MEKLTELNWLNHRFTLVQVQGRTLKHLRVVHYEQNSKGKAFLHHA